jgi:hypothetical protein
VLILKKDGNGKKPFAGVWHKKFTGMREMESAGGRKKQ